MPVALNIDWSAVKILAREIGIVQAADRLGISRNTLLARSAREGWLQELRDARTLAESSMPPTIKPRAIHAINPAEAHAAYMRESSKKTRSAAAKVAQRALEHLAAAPIDEVLEKMPSAVGAVKVGSVAHGWQSGQNNAPAIRLDVLARMGEQGQVAIRAEMGGFESGIETTGYDDETSD